MHPLSSMLACPFAPQFLDTYSLGCNAFCMVISFLVVWSICLSYFLVHFKKSSRISNNRYSPGIYYFDKVSVTVTRSFPVLLKYFFLTFSFISTCLVMSAPKMPKYSHSSFFDLVGVVCHFSLKIWHIFLCQIQFL